MILSTRDLKFEVYINQLSEEVGASRFNPTCVYVHIYIYICVYIYRDIHIHKFTYTYTQLSLVPPSFFRVSSGFNPPSCWGVSNLMDLPAKAHEKKLSPNWGLSRLSPWDNLQCILTGLRFGDWSFRGYEFISCMFDSRRPRGPGHPRTLQMEHLGRQISRLQCTASRNCCWFNSMKHGKLMQQLQRFVVFISAEHTPDVSGSNLDKSQRPNLINHGQLHFLQFNVCISSSSLRIGTYQHQLLHCYQVGTGPYCAARSIWTWIWFTLWDHLAFSNDILNYPDHEFAHRKRHKRHVPSVSTR